MQRDCPIEALQEWQSGGCHSRQLPPRGLGSSGPPAGLQPLSVRLARRVHRLASLPVRCLASLPALPVGLCPSPGPGPALSPGYGLRTRGLPRSAGTAGCGATCTSQSEGAPGCHDAPPHGSSTAAVVAGGGGRSSTLLRYGSRCGMLPRVLFSDPPCSCQRLLPTRIY